MKSYNEIDLFIDYIKYQKLEIEKYKWIQSEKCGHDVGDDAIMYWLQNYSKTYLEWRNRKNFCN